MSPRTVRPVKVRLDKGGNYMAAVEITGKMKKIGAFLLLLIMCASYPVQADQQFVLTVGDTMVIPCLLEIWSDQSVSCVISNPEVLMTDGSGRAVIALAEGTSDVYVHMTNPESDMRYTFVVEPALRWETAGDWELPEETAADGGAAAGDGTRVGDGAEVNEGNHVSGGAKNGGRSGAGNETEVNGEPQIGVEGQADGETYAGDEAHVSSGTTVNDTGREGRALADERTDADGGASPGSSTDSQQGAHLSEEDPVDSEFDLRMPEEDRADSESDLHIPEDERGAREMTESVPFWEDRGSGGITFRVIGDDLSEKTELTEGSDNQDAKYRPFAYLESDGEVAPLFVCAAGREVRWKYVGRILYIEAAPTYTGPYRVCARDSRRNIYYFSS